MTKTDTEIAQRVRLLKACLGVTTKGLADKLGISRATLNNAIKAENPRRLNPGVYRRLTALESQSDLDKLDNNCISKQQGEYGTGCRACDAKDEEISYLRERLKVSENNLAAMIELLNNTTGFADPASSAISGTGGGPARKKKGE